MRRSLVLLPTILMLPLYMSFTSATPTEVAFVGPLGASGEAPIVGIPIEAAALPRPPKNPYEGWEGWCEDLYKLVCDPEKDSCPLDRTGAAQDCRKPDWSRREGSNVYMCEPRWFTSSKQKAQRVAQGMIVGELCKWPAWAKDLSEWGSQNRMGSDPSKLCWRLRGGTKAQKACSSGHFCQPNKLHKLLRLVAARESTWNNTVSHILNPDVEANRKSYRKAKKAKRYKDNPHFLYRDRWERGYGWYGMNASLHVNLWDATAPPEILCRQVESTEAYLRKARRSFRKLWSKYGDTTRRTYELDTGKKVRVVGVTWYDVHRAASSGKLTPEKIIKTRRWSKKKKKWRKFGFVSRARSKRVKLNPFETVMWEMLGKPIPRDTQNKVAESIRKKIRMHFKPSPTKNDASTS